VQKMIIYNTTFHIENDIVDECVLYLKKNYIPKAASSGFLMQPCLRKVMTTHEDEGSSYSVQFHVKNIDTLNYWMQHEGQLLQKELIDCFGSRVVGFTTLLEDIDWER